MKKKRRLKEEVDSTIGSKQHISTDDLNKLKYLESVIKETLRKWSITPLINRQSTAPIRIYDFDIPIGSEIQVLKNFKIKKNLTKFNKRYRPM